MSKFAIITGASSGIGQETAHLFAEKKWLTVVLGRKLARFKEMQNSNLGKMHAISLDLTQQPSINKAAKKITSLLQEAQPGEIALINCAGVYHTQHPESLTLKDWEKDFQTNFFGTVQFTQLLLPYLISHQKGSIVNVSSTLGKKPISQAIPYSVSKAALNHWTQSLALALGKYKIRVNAVCPGIVDTPIHHFHFLKGKAKHTELKKLNKLQPLGRIGKAHEIARSIYFLASSESSWTTGALLDVDGGINLT